MGDGGKENDKELLTFSLASFFNDLGSDMIYPVWPLFVTSFLGANMFILGLIDGIGETIAALSKALSGYFSDKTGKRKVFIWIGYFMSFASRLGYAASSLWWHLIPFKVLDRAGKIRGAPRDAIVADISKENRGRNFGILRTMDNLGAVCGVLLCLFLMQFFSLKTILMIAAVPSLLSVAMIVLFIKEGRRGEVKRVSLSLFDRNFKIFLISAVFLSLATFSYSFLLIFVKNAGFPDMMLPVFYLLFTFIAAIASYPAGRLSDMLGSKRMLYVSMIIYSLMLVGFIYTRQLWLFFMLFILYGLFKGIVDTVQSSFAASLSPKDMKATGIGSLQLIIG
ncbi:MAG: MFS transporter, partial [Nanoarchaeota archaeon]|nr:MFS transporter [Nanoarchaeota archaeon]